MAEEKLDLFQRAQVRRKSCGASRSLPIRVANSFTTCQTSFSVTPLSQGLPALLTFRKSFPLLTPAATIQSFNSR